ncbi:MAG TPA: NAD(P)-dependent oxidoreductase [Solirubrobacteraceae bacterium]|nr:NAD(P)-dependent oxidoreductase [Solirubrobacteraceae bacterium]
MKVLLAGATGAIGRPLVRRLVEAGHEVTGLTRRPERARRLEAAGARGVVCDVIDRAATLAVVEEAAPDVVMDQTTALPQKYDARKMWRFYEGMVELRLRGTPNLIEAAQQFGAGIAFQSVAFEYAPKGNGRLCTEDDPVYEKDAPFPWDLALPAIVALERRVVDLGGLVLRYGMFYGPGTHFDEGGQIHEDVRRRRMPIVGGGTGVFSFIHVEDAAAATVLALERGVTGILNVVDDQPLPMREWLPDYARALGARKPFRVPAWPVRRMAPLAAHWATTLPGASNGRARRELGWAPERPSIREGIRA